MIDQAKMTEIITAILKGDKISIDDGVDVWTFDKTQQHRKDVMGRQFISIAANIDQQYLYRLEADPLTINTRIYLIDERGIALYNFSICELLNKKDLFKITSKMREGEEIKRYRSFIEQYAQCPGSLYWIALELSLAVYDERGSEEMDKESQQLFRDLAEKGDARACHELANHYYFNTSERDEVIKWRTRAIEEGETADLKELADFIIDEYPDKVHLALDTLHTMQQNNINTAWAYWKEGLIYMKGIGGITPDPGRGFLLTEKASGLGHIVAKSDLASFYYQGMGVAKDLHKALQLLIEANEASKKVHNQYMDLAEEEESMEEGDFEEQIALIKKELGQQ